MNDFAYSAGRKTGNALVDTAKHIKRHKKIYAVAALTTGAYLYGVKRGSIVDLSLLEDIKTAGVEENLIAIYKDGFVPLLLNDKQYDLWLAAAVNAGEFTPDVAQQGRQVLEMCRNYAGYKA